MTHNQNHPSLSGMNLAWLVRRTLPTNFTRAESSLRAVSNRLRPHDVYAVVKPHLLNQTKEGK